MCVQKKSQIQDDECGRFSVIGYVQTCTELPCHQLHTCEWEQASCRVFELDKKLQNCSNNVNFYGQGVRAPHHFVALL